MTAPIVVSFGAATHPGVKRAVNEDSYIAAAPVFLVADGMGGHEAGDVASATVVDEFAQLAGTEALTPDIFLAATERARVRVEAISDGPKSAGSTLTGVGVAEMCGAGTWLVVNIGDSRTYRFAGGVLTQLTTDHSAVQELLDAGAAAQAVHVGKNVITRAIGAGSVGSPDVWTIPAATGDRMLVCSDGLTNEVSDEDIAEILASEPSAERAAQMLVDLAVENGGRDNITVVIVDADRVRSANADGIDEDTLPRAAALV